MEKITPEATINDVNRKPLAYALMILGALVSVFVGMYFFSNNRSTNACEAEKAQLRADLNAARADLTAERIKSDNLTHDLLVAKGALDAIPRAVDSIRNH